MSVFIIILIIGIVLPIASLALAGVFESIEAVFHIAGPDGGLDSPDGGSQIGSGGIQLSLLPASPIIWCALLIGAGAAGAILEKTTALPLWAIWPISATIGYALVLLFDNGLYRPLKKAGKVARKSREIIGQLAEVHETILENGVGSVLLKQGLVLYAAQSVDGCRIDQGQEVVIVRIANEKVFVHKSDDIILEL